MIWILFLIFGLDVVDLVLTLKGIREGYLEEDNPLMEKIVRNRKLVAFLKLVVGTAFVVVLWIGRKYLLAKIGASFVLTVYLYILALHIRFIIQSKREEE